MSEEEAIENLKHIVEHWKPDDINDELANIEYNSIKVAVELIDKLQKELKDSINARFELQRRIDKTQKENEVLKEEIEHKQETIDKIMKELEKFYMKYDVISKDKIRELKQKLLEEGYNLTEEQRQKETEFRQGKLKAYEELLGETKDEE